MLRARRIGAQVLVQHGHPDPEGVRHRIDEALSDRMRRALAAACASRFDERDESVWVIRRLTFQVVVDAAWDPTQLARVMALQLTRAVERAIAQGGDGVEVMRFRDRAEHLARFATELARGTAWSRWYFDAFDGVRALPLPAALRTVLSRDPALGRAALAALSPRDAADIGGAFGTPDARRVLDALVADLPDDDAGGAVRVVLEAWTALGTPPAQGEEERLALRVVAEALRRHHALGPYVVATARAMARLASLAAEGGVQPLVASRAILAGRLASLAPLGEDTLRRLAPLLHAPAAHVEALLDAVAQRANGEHRRSDSAEAVYTPFGVVAMLAPFVAALPLAAATRGWPPCVAPGDMGPRADPASVVRLLVLATCCGDARAARVVDDTLARRLAGVPPAIDTTTLRGWLARLGVPHAARLEWVVGDWRRGRMLALERLLLTEAGEDSLILADAERGVWIAARHRGAPNGATRAVRSLRRWLEAPIRNGPRRLVIARDPELASALRARYREVEVIEWPAALPLPDPRAADALEATLARADRLPGDLAWAMPNSLHLPYPFALAIAVVAQGVLRDVSWRLPGFARASLPYLHANFFSMDGSVVEEPGRTVVHLGRPPLSMVLAMTGMQRAVYRLPWLGDRPVGLFPEGVA